MIHGSHISSYLWFLLPPQSPRREQLVNDHITVWSSHSPSQKTHSLIVMLSHDKRSAMETPTGYFVPQHYFVCSIMWLKMREYLHCSTGWPTQRVSEIAWWCWEWGSRRVLSTWDRVPVLHQFIRGFVFMWPNMGQSCILQDSWKPSHGILIRLQIHVCCQRM